jgi:hypothetical protein
MSQLSKSRLWTSYILQGVIVVMFLMGALTNLFQVQQAVDGAVSMGYPASSVMYLGVVLLISTVLYAYPKTTVIGAILLTGWLGGAVATHVIHQDPIMNTIFPIIFGVIVWVAIYLRNDRLLQFLGIS